MFDNLEEYSYSEMSANIKKLICDVSKSEPIFTDSYQYNVLAAYINIPNEYNRYKIYVIFKKFQVIYTKQIFIPVASYEDLMSEGHRYHSYKHLETELVKTLKRLLNV